MPHLSSEERNAFLATEPNGDFLPLLQRGVGAKKWSPRLLFSSFSGLERVSVLDLGDEPPLQS